MSPDPPPKPTRLPNSWNCWSSPERKLNRTISDMAMVTMAK
jgi:hypothetical protein